MRHDVRGRGTLALPQRGFVLLAQGGSLMALTLNPKWGDMLIGVGKSGCAGLPSLQTVRAVLPHTAI